MPENILGLNVPLLVQGWLQASIQLSAHWWRLWDLTRGKADGWQRTWARAPSYTLPSLLHNVRTKDQAPNTFFEPLFIPTVLVMGSRGYRAGGFLGMPGTPCSFMIY